MRRLAAWGWPEGSPASDDAALLVAELAANAVLHGRLPHWYFGLRLAIIGTATLRVEVTDTRPDHRPPGPAGLDVPPPAAESGRGLLLVHVLADRWGVSDGDPFTKTVWCERDLSRSRP